MPVNPVPKVTTGAVGTTIPVPNVTVTVPAAGTAVPVKAAVQLTEVAPATVELGVTDTDVNPANTIAAEPDVATESLVVATVKPVGPYDPATGLVKPGNAIVVATVAVGKVAQVV